VLKHDAQFWEIGSELAQVREEQLLRVEHGDVLSCWRDQHGSTGVWTGL
jgi:hypothetical protein